MTATRKQHSIVIQGKEFQKIAVVKRFFALLRMTEPQNLSCWNEVKRLTRGVLAEVVEDIRGCAAETEGDGDGT